MPHAPSPRALNRALLARQLLLERSTLPITGVLEAMGGLQAQYAPSMYIGLWSRMERFARDHLTRALEDRTVVQGTLLRSTIHLVSAHDYWPFALATRATRRQSWLRVRQLNVTDEDMTAAAARVRDRLRAGPMTRTELDEMVGKPQSNVVGAWIDMVRVPPSGTWERRRADLYAAAEEWLGPPPPDLTPGAGIELLVRRYLGAFGPSAAADMANWAGLAVSDVTPAIARLPLRRRHTVEGHELLDLDGAPLPDPDAPAPARFLPTWDASLLVHARSKGILAEHDRPLVFNTKTPHSVNTFLVDGTVAGTWRYERGTVQIEPFGRLTRDGRREVDAEAERVAELHR